MKLGITVALMLALSLPLTTVTADGPHDKAIKARQGLMQVYSFNLGILGAMAKGEMDYDADAASAAAGNLLAAVTMKSGAMWPAGSDGENADNLKNRAKPEIWSTYPKIAEAGKAMQDAAMSLNDAAGGGLDSLKGAIGPAGKSCKGCHDDFRAEKK